MILITTIMSSLLAGVGTFLCSTKLKWHPIKSSSILSLIVATPFEFWGIQEYDSIPLIFFGATFVGMNSEKILNINEIAISSLLFAFLHYFLSEQFNFVGGTLGTTACLACLTVISIKFYSKEAKANL